MSVFGDAELFEEFEIKSVKADESGSSSGTRSDAEEEDDQDERYKDLLAENEKLKRTLRLLERPAYIKVKDACKDGPIAHVILFNNHISRNFRDEIQDFFCKLCSRSTNSDPYPDIKPPFVQYLPPRDEKAYKRSSKRAEAVTKAFQGFSSIQVYDNFFIDHLGQPLYYQSPAHSDWVFPKYESVEFEPLSGDMESSVRAKKRIQRMCFNCGGTDHQIKDCEEPRDQQAINDRRQKFLNEVAKYSQGSPQIRLDGPRYHEEDDGTAENKERFEKFKPGVISVELQEALGMKEDDLPPYIYQMRRLGYPPGHLSSARKVDSGLSLYEEGEINGRVPDNEYAPVDVDKIISYPGFNQPPLPGQQDKFEENDVYPIDYQQSKEVMISYYEHRNSLYNQQKAIEDQNRKNQEIGTRNGAVIEEVDMDMADDDTGTEMSIGNSDADLEDGEVAEISATGVKIMDDVVNLTEDELEEKRELLLKELQQSNENNNDSDYRNIKSSDQDYRIIQSEFHEIVTEDTPESPDEGETEAHDEPSTQVVTTEEVIDLTDQCSVEDIPVDLKERSLSSDTDYRVRPPLETDHIASPAGSSTQTSTDTQQINDDVIGNDSDDGQRLPGRHKFAKGISKFDDYFSESKSQGVYNKLRLLLKDSPRRQDK